MTGNDVNQVLDNICDKLGTTAKTLIPEMAGYQIARNSLWIIFGLMCLAVAIFYLVQCIQMRKLDVKWQGMIHKEIKSRIDRDPEYWSDYELKAVTNNSFCFYDEDYTWRIFIICITGLLGMLFLINGIINVLGWALAPNAKMVMWLMSALPKH